MNHSKLYVPNPQKWVDFFDKVAKVKQSGGGKVPQILPLDKYTTIESQNKELSVKAVSPAEQTVQQARSELERENIKPSTVVEMNHKLKPRRLKRMSKKKKTAKLRRGKNRKIVKISRKRQKGGKKVKHRRKVKSKKSSRKDIFSF